MKLSRVVAIVLFVTLITYSAITLIGSKINPVLAGFIFFTITLFTFIVTLLNIKQSHKDIKFVLFEMIILCICFSFLLGVVKYFNVQIGDNQIQKANIQDEIDYLSKTNQYYLNYIDYLKNNTQMYQLNNAELQKRLDEEKNSLSEGPEIASKVYPDDYEDEEMEDD